MTNETLEQFLKDVQDHQLTVNMENGVFRDITVKNPRSSDMHYNITTRSGYLIYTGDMGCFVFQRLHDMFNFFRDEKGYSINPYYWSEKVQGVEKGEGIKQFSASKAEKRVKEHLDYYLNELDMVDPADRKMAEEAREAIDSLISEAHDHEVEFFSTLRDWDEKDAGGLSFDDWYEMDFTDYTSRYLWACYAIVHAIKLYDAHKLDSRRALFESEILPNLKGGLELVFDAERKGYVIPSEMRKLGVEGAAQDILLHRIDGAYMGWMKAMEKNNAIN